MKEEIKNYRQYSYILEGLIGEKSEFNPEFCARSLDFFLRDPDLSLPLRNICVTYLEACKSDQVPNEVNFQKILAFKASRWPKWFEGLGLQILAWPEFAADYQVFIKSHGAFYDYVDEKVVIEFVIHLTHAKQPEIIFLNSLFLERTDFFNLPKVTREAQHWQDHVYSWMVTLIGSADELLASLKGFSDLILTGFMFPYVGQNNDFINPWSSLTSINPALAERILQNLIELLQKRDHHLSRLVIRQFATIKKTRLEKLPLSAKKILLDYLPDIKKAYSKPPKVNLLELNSLGAYFRFYKVKTLGGIPKIRISSMFAGPKKKKQ